MKVLGKTGSRNVEKVSAQNYTHAICKKTDEVLPLEQFRIHKTGYYFGYSKKWERQQARKRRIMKMEQENMH